MQKLRLLFPALLFLVACAQQPAEPQKDIQPLLPDSEVNTQGDEGEQEDDAGEDIGLVSASADVAVLAGAIDYFPFVMQLGMENEQATGHYLYTKQGKRIDLKGHYDAGEGQWILEEQVGGRTTGYFQVSISSESISGIWSAKSDFSAAKDVTGRRLDVPYEPNSVTGKRISGLYQNKGTTTTYEGDDANGEPIEKEYDVTDQCAVRYIGGGYFSFWLTVTGANYHTGEVSGVGKIAADYTGVTDMEDCKIGFDFRTQGSVTVEEEDCGDYHGARAWFGGTYRLK